jgi:RNA polymerase sigma-70 factor, ECF subfamily
MGKNRLIDEKQCLNQLRQGDEKAFEKIFNAYFNILFTYAHNLLEKPFIAEDVVENVFLKLWERREIIIIKGPLLNYLLASVKNACLDQIKSEHIRRNYRERVIKKALLDENFEFHEIISADPLQEKELKKAIKKSVQNLPADYRKVFKMSRYYNMTNREIAAKLGISSHTAGKYLNLALQRLKNSLKDLFH